MSEKSRKHSISVEDVLKNIRLEPVNINHAALERIGDSVHKSQCPECESGVLLMRRDPDTMKLKKEDNCICCGRRFIYQDLEESVMLKYKSNP